MEIYCKLLTTLTARAICGANIALLIVCSKSEFIGFPCQKCSFNRTIKCCFSAIYWLMSTDTLFSCIGRCPGNLPTIKLWSKKLFNRIRQVNVSRVKGSINLQLDFKNKKTYDELKRDFISRNYQINDNRLLTNSLQNDEWLQLVRTSHRTTTFQRVCSSKCCSYTIKIDSRAQQLCGISWSHFSLTAARRSWQISCLTAKQLTGSPPVPLFALTETLCLSSTRDRQFIAPSFEECYYFPIFSHTKIRIFSRIRFRFKFIDPACR